METYNMLHPQATTKSLKIFYNGPRKFNLKFPGTVTCLTNLMLFKNWEVFYLDVSNYCVN